MQLLISGGEVVTPSGVMEADILIEGRKIKALGKGLIDSRELDEHIEATGCLVVPGFIDLHTHGIKGFSALSGDTEAIARMAEHFAAAGVTAFYPTVGGESLEQIVRTFEAVKEAMGKEIKGAQILGIHAEGPYLNPTSPARGANPESWLRKPDREEVRDLIQAAEGKLRLMTLAPELPGAQGVIEELLAAGVTVAVGHSDATYDEAIRAFDWGVTHAIHTFNGMRRFHHREPGVLGAVLTDRRAWAEVIADGVHLHPATVRLTWLCKGPDRLGGVTDSTEMAGLPPGIHAFAGQEVVIEEERAYLRQEGTLAGSVATFTQMFNNLVDRWGFSLTEAVALCSTNPAQQAKVSNRKGSIETGKDGDLVLLERGQVALTMVGGEVVFRRDENTFAA